MPSGLVRREQVTPSLVLLGWHFTSSSSKEQRALCKSECSVIKKHTRVSSARLWLSALLAPLICPFLHVGSSFTNRQNVAGLVFWLLHPCMVETLCIIASCNSVVSTAATIVLSHSIKSSCTYSLRNESLNNESSICQVKTITSFLHFFISNLEERYLRGICHYVVKATR